MKQNNPWLWRSLIVGILLLAALLPVTTLAAPDWSVCVVNESNRPVPGVLVRESYQNYSAESGGNEEDQCRRQRLRSLRSKADEGIRAKTLDRHCTLWHGRSSR